MSRYQFFPLHIAAALARPSRLAAITTAIEDGNPADHLARLRFYPGLVARLAVEGSLSLSILGQYPELLVPAFEACSDKFAFAVLADGNLTAASEGMLTEYVLAARRAGIADSLLEGALGQIESPWRLEVLGYPGRASILREARPDDIRTRFSDYIASGAIHTTKEFEGAVELSAEEAFEYCAVRLRSSPHRTVDPRVLERASPQLAFNLVRPGANLVTPSNTPILTLWEVLAAAQSDPIWALEYLLAKCAGHEPDSPAVATEIALWVPDREFRAVGDPALREELGSILT